MHKIGEDRTERLDIVPAQLRLIVTVRPRYAIVHVNHSPPGRSKRTRIEHRLFCHITQNWRGRPLTDRFAVVELIGATTTRTGLKVECAIDASTYEKGMKVSDAEMASLRSGGRSPSSGGGGGCAEKRKSGHMLCRLITEPPASTWESAFR